jgi:predicted permease
MTTEPGWRRYLRFWRRDVAADVDDELAFHFEQRVQQFMAAGSSREEAVARARERFGSVDDTRTALLEIGQRGGHRRDRAGVFDALRQDVAFALRTLRRSPGVAVASVAIIALGVGANGAMFSLADRLFLRPPAGVSHPEDLRRLYVRTNWSVGQLTVIRSAFTYQAYLAFASGLAPRVKLVGYSSPDTMPMRVANATTTVHGSYVTPEYMSVLGVRPAMGRFFAADEQVMGNPVYVAVISRRLAQRWFDGDSAALGKTIEVNRQHVTIVGVAPGDFTGADLSATDVWMPLASFPAPADGFWYKSFGAHSPLRLVGRAAPGTPDAWIGNAATAIARRTNSGRINVVRDTNAVLLTGPILEALGPSIKPAPEVAIAKRLVGVTLIVLLIACANVASLLLARAMRRRREIAVRLALGISRRRLVSQLLVEGLVLAVVAGVVALAVSVWAGGALRSAVMPNTYWAGAGMDGRVALFIVIVSLLTGLAAGVVPAFQASRPELTVALKSGARDGGAGVGHARMRMVFLVAQIALSVVLLYGAGLFVRSLSRVRAIDLGFDAERLVYGAVYFVNPAGHYLDYDSLNWGTDRFADIAARVRHMPGVENTSLATAPPMQGYAMVGLYMKDGSRPPRLDNRDPAWTAATPSYFATTGVKLARGRFFTDADRDGPPVMVVNETAARTYWPNEDAIGQCIIFFRPTNPCTVVVGVTKDTHLEDVVEAPTVQLLTPLTYAANGTPKNARNIIVRVAPERATLTANALRQELQRAFPSAATWVMTLASGLEPQLRPWRLGASLFTAFGVLALVVAAFGTYSVIAYSVSQRAHEMSVRVALGASAPDLVRLIVGQGLGVTAVGVAGGIAVSLALGRFVQSLLYGTSVHDAAVVVTVGALLMLIATVASGLPAWRATRADPVAVLRAE